MGQTVRQARAAYFARAGFDESGYDEAWVKLPLGKLTLYMPNTPGRKRAVPRHDIHHVVTGYGTDWVGEFEMSAWEVGAGCGRFLTAWMINLGGLAVGLLLYPRRVWRAFRRGRRCQSLYDGRPIDDELLDRPLSELSAELLAGDHAARS